MIAFLTVIHVIVCIVLILVVLLQQGKGQDIGSAFGGGGSQTTFGSRGGATLMTKLTAVAAAMFMVTSLTLTIMISRPGVGSVIDDGTVIPTVPIEDLGLPLNPLPDDVEAPDAGDADAEAAEPTAPAGAEGGLAPAPGEETEN